MKEIFSKGLAILAIILFAPTTLVLASQNAVQGDVAYPVKRGMENVIIAIASLHPKTKAMFHLDLSKRRFKEVASLVEKGKSAKDTLAELVSQTDTAAEAASDFQNLDQRDDYIKQLTRNIDDFDQGLAQLEKSVSESKQPVPPVPVYSPASTNLLPLPTHSNTDSSTPPTGVPVPTTTLMPISAFTPTPTRVLTSAPTLIPQPSPQPSPRPAPQPPDQQEEIKQARKKLETIKKKLEGEKRKLEKPEKNKYNSP